MEELMNNPRFSLVNLWTTNRAQQATARFLILITSVASLVSMLVVLVRFGRRRVAKDACLESPVGKLLFSMICMLCVVDIAYHIPDLLLVVDRDATPLWSVMRMYTPKDAHWGPNVVYMYAREGVGMISTWWHCTIAWALYSLIVKKRRVVLNVSHHVTTLGLCSAAISAARFYLFRHGGHWGLPLSFWVYSVVVVPLCIAAMLVWYSYIIIQLRADSRKKLGARSGPGRAGSMLNTFSFSSSSHSGHRDADDTHTRVHTCPLAHSHTHDGVHTHEQPQTDVSTDTHDAHAQPSPRVPAHQQDNISTYPVTHTQGDTQFHALGVYGEEGERGCVMESAVCGEEQRHASGGRGCVGGGEGVVGGDGSGSVYGYEKGEDVDIEQGTGGEWKSEREQRPSDDAVDACNARGSEEAEGNRMSQVEPKGECGCDCEEYDGGDMEGVDEQEDAITACADAVGSGADHHADADGALSNADGDMEPHKELIRRLLRISLLVAFVWLFGCVFANLVWVPWILTGNVMPFGTYVLVIMFTRLIGVMDAVILVGLRPRRPKRSARNQLNRRERLSSYRAQQPKSSAMSNYSNPTRTVRSTLGLSRVRRSDSMSMGQGGS